MDGLRAQGRSWSARQPQRRRLTLVAILAVLASWVPAGLAMSSGAAHAANSNFGYKLLGCIQDGTITITPQNLVCPDGGTPTGGAYTTGNMGKLWNELDIVPHRVILTDNTAEDVTFYVAGDHHQSSVNDPKIGWDVIGSLVLNVAESDASCPPLPTMGTQTVEPGQAGGAFDTIQRSVTLHMPVTSTGCVYDYYQRLAIGASLYTGSSLQSYVIFNGQKRIQLPVGAIQPQQLGLDMHAVENSAFSWNVVKNSTTTVDFGNTCSNTLSSAVTTTVTWTKDAGTPSGYTVTTNVTATNPAARDVTVDPTLTVFSGTNAIDGPTDLGPKIVLARSDNSWTVITHVTDLSTLTATNPPSFNASATATYADVISGVPVPGTTSATTSLLNRDISSGSNSGDSGVVTDTESITGTGLQFSADSATTGSFTGGYVATTKTTGPVGWSSGTVSGSGSVTIDKTVYVASKTVINNGDLYDTATVDWTADSFTTPQHNIPITAEATPTLDVSKTTSEQFVSAKTYTFHLMSGTSPSGTDTGRSTTTFIPAGSEGPVVSDSVSADTLSATNANPSPSASYYFHEDAQAPYSAQDSSGATFAVTNGALNACSAEIDVQNVADPPLARVQKITLPAGATTWTFRLAGKKADGSAFTEDKVATAGAGYVQFAQPLEFDGGTYTITEIPTAAQAAAWDLTNISGYYGTDDPSNQDPNRVSENSGSKSCSFTVHLTSDFSPNFMSCTFTNTERADVSLLKQLNGGTIPSGSTFNADFTLYNRGADGVFGTGDDSTVATKTANAANAGVLDFGLQQPGSYTMCETLGLGAGQLGQWQIDGTTVTPYNPTPGNDIGVRCYDFTLSAGVGRAFQVNDVLVGGNPLTIGYWKNWNSLARSSSFLAKHSTMPTVDSVLAKLGGTITLGVNDGSGQGYVTVTSVQTAVNVLGNASTKYAEHGLAAQLLAAKLNVGATAFPSCTTIGAWITQGDSLLSMLKNPPFAAKNVWSNATYQTTAAVPSNNSLRGLFTAAHDTLNAFNNGVCPTTTP